MNPVGRDSRGPLDELLTCRFTRAASLGRRGSVRLHGSCARTRSREQSHRDPSPAGSPRCPGSRNYCGSRPRPTAAPAGPGGPAPHRPHPSTRTPRPQTSASATPAARPSARNSTPSSTHSPSTASRQKVFSEKISTGIRVRPQFEAALAAAREIKAHAPHCRVILTVHEMKRLGHDAAELTALADHLTAHGLVLEMLAGPLPGMYDPSGPGRLLFEFFAAMAETERENVRESTLEGLDTAARKGKHGGRPLVITDDMLHTVLRRRAAGESVEQIQPDLIIPTGKRKGHSPSVASIYRALTEHEKAQAYPEAIEAAQADFAALRQRSATAPANS
ncbi:recombinase family protein [Streptomyces sp. NBC_01506]|uniref:recombinase family protein n=1 Tax=Streptomyces sp. NBC_01506 TaxID=2903887 RepID=UPI0038641F36